MNQGYIAESLCLNPLLIVRRRLKVSSSFQRLMCVISLEFLTTLSSGFKESDSAIRCQLPTLPHWDNHVLLPILPHWDAYVLLPILPQEAGHILLTILPHWDDHVLLPILPHWDAYVLLPILPQEEGHILLTILPQGDEARTYCWINLSKSIAHSSQKF